jgi:hypothetical protein
VKKFCAKPTFAGEETDVQRGSLAHELSRAPDSRSCALSEGAMRIIAFITDPSTVRDILVHLGEPIAPPRIAPARGPPLWETTGAEHDPSADPVPQPAFEFDQRLTW